MRTRQHGVAIVLAMGVVALAALVATAIMTTQSIWQRHNELSAEHVQAQTVVQVGIDWTRALLGDDRRASAVDTLDEAWAIRLPPIPVDNGSLGGSIEDHQGRFNLNNLVKAGRVNPPQLEHFRGLLAILGMAPELADALADWIDADGDAQAPGGAEDAYYLALPMPYRTANRPLVELAELALVRGYDESVLARLRPFVSALPTFTALNVNTASPEVMAAMAAGLDLDAARALVEKRSRGHFRDAGDFMRQLPAGASMAVENVAVGSDYFMVRLQVSVGSAQAQGVTLLARRAGGWPTILWRKLS